MARDSGMIPAWIISDPRLARAGKDAAILYLQGRTRCDSYGRLPGDPERITAEVTPQWAFKGHISEQEIRDARDALIEQGLWYCYAVGGVEYIEYEGFDGDQQPSWLSKRGQTPTYPDPPDRPELAAKARMNYKGKTKQDSPPPMPPTTARVPPRTEEQSAVSAGETVAQGPHGGEKVRETEDYRDWEHWYFQKTGSFPSAKERSQMDDLKAKGATDQLIVTAIQKAQDDKADRPVAWARKVVADLMLYNIRTPEAWAKHEEAKQVRLAAAGEARDRPLMSWEAEDPRDRIRKQRVAATGEAHAR